MKKRFAYLILPISFLLCGCPSWNSIENGREENNFENVYNLQEVWSTNVRDIYQACKPLQNDNILYVMEDGYEDYGKPEFSNMFHYVLKVNLENGYVCCQSPALPNSVNLEIYEYDNYIFLLDEVNNLIFLNKNDLSIEKIVKIGLEDCSRNGVCHILRYKDNLIWGNKSNSDKKNMVMVNVPDIFELENDQEYIPQLLYDQANGNCVHSCTIDGDVLFFLTSDLFSHQGEEICTLYAFNLETKQTLWKKEIPDILGTMKCSLQIIEDKLYLIETSLFCFNKNTGRIVWKKEQTEEDKQKEVYCAPNFMLSDLLIDNNKVFFSGDLCEFGIPELNYPKENIKNLFCYDLRNGKYVWGDLIPNTAMINALMVINEGKLFISTLEGFRIYDKDTGKLLGDYREYCSKEADRVFYYNDKYIFFDRKNMNARYVAVRLNKK